MPTLGPGLTAPVSDPTAPSRGNAYDPAMLAILATIKQSESGDYASHTRQYGASGAYQFEPGTWDHYGGYAEAYQAPPAVQDAKAAAEVTSILQQYPGNVAIIPIYWYGGPAVAKNPKIWNTIPAGNSLSYSQYQANWMNKYAKNTGSNVTFTPPGPGQTAAQANEPGASGTPQCLFTVPSVNLIVGSVGGWCFGDNLARAIAGPMLIGVGSIIMLAGVSMMVKFQAGTMASNMLKQATGRTPVQLADKRVMQQRGERLTFEQQRYDQRLAAARQTEGVRTEAAGIRQEQAAAIRSQERIDALGTPRARGQYTREPGRKYRREVQASQVAAASAARREKGRQIHEELVARRQSGG